MVHKLKTVQPFFDAVWSGDKTFEVRKNDRNFNVGDRLMLIEVLPEGRLDARYVLKDITYILKGGQFGIDKDYVVMGLKDVR